MYRPFFVFALLLVACSRPAVQQAPPSATSKRAGYEAIAHNLEDCGSEPRIVLSAEAGDSPKGPVLIFRLTNVSKETLATYPERLPWGNPNSIEVAASSVSGETAPTVWPIADPPPAAKITIAPGDSLVGQALLRDRIATISDIQKRGGVLVSWSYRSPFIEAPSRRCFSGIAFLPRRPN